MRQWIYRVSIAAALGLLVPQPAICQEGRLPLSEILTNLFGNTIVLAPRSTPEVPSHAAHFKPSPEQLQTPEQFNQQIVTLLSTFPFGSSSGGFTYTYDPALGTFSRSSESFGPLFAERALTIGRERGSLGVAYQRSKYDTFEGKNLRQREINFYIQHTDCCGKVQNGAQAGDGSLLNPAFEGDIIEAALALNLTTDTVVFSATYGLTDRLDLGVAVPLVAVDIDASIRARILRLATAANPDLHVFEGDNPDEHIFALSGHAAGLGDVLVRAKYNFLTRARRRTRRGDRRADAYRRRKQSARHRCASSEGLRHRVDRIRQASRRISTRATRARAAAPFPAPRCTTNGTTRRASTWPSRPA